MEDQLQRQRFERKYFISEKQAGHIREFLKRYLVPDEFSASRPDLFYPVHSLYLDSSELTTYWATVHCEKKRFKLRVRFYDSRPESPLFFEIKRRENECVLKQRGAVHRTSGARLLVGHLPSPDDLLSNRPYHLAALQRFCYLSQRLLARPKVHVAYSREAWVSPQSNSVRVTMDKEVRGEPRHEAIFTTDMSAPVYPFGKQLVLELKFTDRFPDWFLTLVRHFNLTQTGAPKYCGSIFESGEEYVAKGAPVQWRQKLEQVIHYC
jgi:hypothetical protein